MEGKKPVKCWIMEQQYRSIKSWVEDGARDPEVHETRTATPAVAVPLEDYMEVRRLLTWIDENTIDTYTKGHAQSGLRLLHEVPQ